MTLFFEITMMEYASHAVSTSRQRQPFQKSFLCLDGHFNIRDVASRKFLRAKNNLCRGKYFFLSPMIININGCFTVAFNA